MFLTIFTYVNGQARLLPQMYSNLLVQLCNDFEWIIVVDTDDKESQNILKQWITSNELSIYLYIQKSHGKHIAYNHALQNARGELFFCLEPEDFITGDFVEEIKNYWQMTYHASEYKFYNRDSLTSLPKEELPPVKGPTAAQLEKEIAVTPDRHEFSLFGRKKQEKKGQEAKAAEEKPTAPADPTVAPASENLSIRSIFQYLDRTYEKRKERSFQKKFNAMPTSQVTYIGSAIMDEPAQTEDYIIFKTKKAQKYLDKLAAQKAAEEAAAAAEAAPEPEPEPEPEPIPEPEPGPLIPERITMEEINAAWSDTTLPGLTKMPVLEVEDEWILAKYLPKKKAEEDETPYGDREISGIIAYARSAKGERIGGEMTLNRSVTFYSSTIKKVTVTNLKTRFLRHFDSVNELPVVRTVLYRTEILKKYRFPVYPKETYIRDDVLYYQPDTTYALLPFPKDLLVRPVMPQMYEGLPLIHKMIKNPIGAQAFFGARIDLSLGFISRAANIVQYLAYQFLKPNKHYTYKGGYRHEFWMYVIPGFFYALYLERLKFRDEI